MKTFKWSLDFHPKRESPIVPVWVSFPNFKTHSFKKSATMAIAKAIGNPLYIDKATANDTRPNIARFKAIQVDDQGESYGDDDGVINVDPKSSLNDSTNVTKQPKED
ncbi:Uncharacterized protein TCM_041218 [Theobroma cacao]|uniref:Uncharacterized protein n=1 Tax=Theobroma cacao TaxID=3641 RepID=A0A061GTW9_THECC|nr:Uncharacterized protein TCM_041218 [Theobroma cacao]